MLRTFTLTNLLFSCTLLLFLWSGGQTFSQCNEVDADLSTLDCKSEYFVVKIEALQNGQRLPPGSECEWTIVRGNKQIKACAFLDSVYSTGSYQAVLRVRLPDLTTCVIRDSITLSRVDKLKFDVNPPLPFCNANEPTTIRCTNMEVASGDWTIKSPDGSFFENKDGAELKDYRFPPGKYWVVARLTEKLGCTYIDSIEIDVPKEVSINLKVEPEKFCAYNGEREFTTKLTSEVQTVREIEQVEIRAPKGNPNVSRTGVLNSLYRNTDDTITVTVKLKDGCELVKKFPQKFRIFSVVKPVMEQDKDTICHKDSVIFRSETVDNPPAEGKLSWSGATQKVDPDDPEQKKKIAVFYGKDAKKGWNTVKLTYTNDSCKVTDSLRVYVIKPELDFDAPRPKRILCRAGVMTPTKIKNYDSTYTYAWKVIRKTTKDTIFERDFSKDSTFDYTATFEPEAYHYMMIAKSPEPFSCLDTLIKKDFIIIKTPKADIEPLPKSVWFNDPDNEYSVGQLAMPKDSIPTKYTWKMRLVKDTVSMQPIGQWHTFGDTAKGKMKLDTANIGWNEVIFVHATRIDSCPDTIRTKLLVKGMVIEVAQRYKHILRGVNNAEKLGATPLFHRTVKYLVDDSKDITYEWQVDPDDGNVTFIPSAVTKNLNDSVMVRFKRDSDTAGYKFSLTATTPFDPDNLNPKKTSADTRSVTSDTLSVLVGMKAKIVADSVKCILGPQKLYLREMGYIVPDTVKWRVISETPGIPNPVIIGNPGIKDTVIQIQALDYGSYRAFADVSATLDSTNRKSFEGTFETQIKHGFEFTASPETLYCPFSTSNIWIQTVPYSVSKYVLPFKMTFTSADTSFVVYSPTPSVPRRPFTKLGVYSVTLEVTYEDSCKDLIHKKDLIHVLSAKAKIDIAGGVGCDGKLLDFQNNSVGADRLTVTFGNSSQTYQGDEQLIQYRFDLSPSLPQDRLYQEFYISAYATIKGNCQEYADKNDQSYDKDTVRIYRIPKASFTVDPLTPPTCPPYEITLTNTSKYGEAWDWDFNNDGTFGDSVSVNAPKITLRPKGTSPVSYQFAIRVWNSGGCEDIYVSLAYVVQPGTYADFEVDRYGGCTQENNSTIQFKDKSETSMYNIQNWNWEFGDGNTSTDQNPQHTYTADGTYFPKLTVRDNSPNCPQGITHVSPRPIIIGLPKVEFEIDLKQAPNILFFPPAQVLRIKNEPRPDIQKWSWKFGNNPNWEDRTPPFDYTLPEEEGEFKVLLEVTDQFGCRGSAQAIFIQKDQDIDIASVFTPNGDGVNDRFIISYVGEGEPVLKIYDRWGMLVAELSGKASVNTGWDGTYKQQPGAEGTYFYYFQVGNIERSGSVSLVR